MFNNEAFSHELKNQLGMINGILKKTKQETNGQLPRKTIHLLDELSQSIENVISLIGVQMELSEEFHFSNHNIKNVILQAVSIWQYLADSKNIDIRVGIQQDEILEISSPHILLALSIILNNALKYSSDRVDKLRRFVSISGQNLNSGYEISISNTFEGVITSDHNHIDVHGDWLNDNNPGNSRHGLLIMRNIVDNHFGTVSSSSELVNSHRTDGINHYLITFKIWLPSRQPIGNRQNTDSSILFLSNQRWENEQQNPGLRKNALYFPYINVPNDQWFYRNLLYWDKIDSIVPIDFVFNPEMLSSHMRELVSAQLVEQIMPGFYINQIPKFEDAFLEYIDKQLMLKTEMHYSSPNKILTIHSEKIANGIHSSNSFRIHLEKMGSIAHELEQRGLARRTDSNWFFVVDWVGESFMTYLASTLGMLDEINAVPITNMRSNLRKLTGSKVIRRSERNSERVRIRQLLLEKIFPIPSVEIDIDSLTYFKQSHGNLLAKFRDYIEASCIDLSNIRNIEEKEERVFRMERKIETDIEEITDVMKTRWQKITFGTLIPVIGAGIAMFIKEPLSKPLAITSTGFSLVSAIYQAFEGSEQYRKVLNQPLAYASFVKNYFHFLN